ncbi:hypothetical protein VTO42DRAFT_7771 [Malbranchea cinnamomea]
MSVTNLKMMRTTSRQSLQEAQIQIISCIDGHSGVIPATEISWMNADRLAPSTNLVLLYCGLFDRCIAEFRRFLFAFLLVQYLERDVRSGELRRRNARKGAKNGDEVDLSQIWSSRAWVAPPTFHLRPGSPTMGKMHQKDGYHWTAASDSSLLLAGLVYLIIAARVTRSHGAVVGELGNNLETGVPRVSRPHMSRA